MALPYVTKGGGYSAQAQTQMYFARKRRRAREEATAGKGGGVRNPRPVLGVKVKVVLVTA